MRSVTGSFYQRATFSTLGLYFLPGGTERASAGPSCLVNLFTSICSAGQDNSWAWGGWGGGCLNQWLQIGNLPILFALGHKEGANSSFCKSSWLYSSLNYGCEKTGRIQRPLPRADTSRQPTHLSEVPFHWIFPLDFPREVV